MLHDRGIGGWVGNSTVFRTDDALDKAAATAKRKLRKQKALGPFESP